MTQPVTLDYAKRQWPWRKWARRGGLAAIVLLLVAAGWYWGGGISRRLAAWYYQRQCLVYSQPATKVIYESDGAAARLLLDTPPRAYKSAGVDEAWLPVACWEGMDRALLLPHPWAYDEIVIFLHERIGRGPGGGQRRLVRVTANRILLSPPPRGMLELHADAWAPGTVFSVPKDVGHYVLGGPFPRTPTITALRVFAGQADPGDESHFSFEYLVAPAVRVKIDGWLEANDSLTLQFGSAMLGPKAATGP